jgi:hypothetical protein
LTTFQFASTALTATVKEEPAVRVPGVPLLPVAVPASALSPGTNSCSFVKAPALTVKLELAGPVVVPSLAVIVAVSAFVNVVASVVVDWPLVKLTTLVYVGVPPGPV